MALQETFEVLEVLPYQEDRCRVHLRLVCGCSIRVVVRREDVIAFPRGPRRGRPGDTTLLGRYECPIGHPVPQRS